MTQLKGILAYSIADVFMIAAMLMGLAMIVSLFLPEIPLKKAKKKEPVIQKEGTELGTDFGEPAIVTH